MKMEKSTREILAKMNGKERLEYIWDYYKWYIIGGIFLLFIITMGTMEFINHKDITFNMMVITNQADYEKVEQLSSTLINLLIPEEKQDDEEILLQVEFYTETEEGIEYPRGVLENLHVQIASQTLDVLIIPEREFAALHTSDKGFLDLKPLINQALSFPEQGIIYGKNGEIYAIKVSELSLLRDVFADPDLVLCVPANSTQGEKMKTFLDYLLANN